jgi:RNA polymerase sigma factor (TIGR02999 family)
MNSDGANQQLCSETVWSRTGLLDVDCGYAMSSPDPFSVSAREAPEGLSERVYRELRVIAAHQMNGERADHTLSATALVHEAFLRMSGPTPAGPPPSEFYQSAARAMRRILIEHARKRGAVKRGGAAADGNGRWSKAAIDVAMLAEDSDTGRIVALDEAVSRLEKQDPRAAAIVHLRFYAGLSLDETAAALGLSRRTVANDWRYARAWLLAELRDEE